ncbi:purine ribonucleoside efflux pump NepI [Microcella alkalica]|uniref:MFS family permease n=1 Tax=Microcella alkalica TaxID=355930 RepID=A0A839EBA5_9MICO|nr:MFS transporter [Microcella alkalica]MBA8847524.1 MFS family permease [Microcella alkalica]
MSSGKSKRRLDESLTSASGLTFSFTLGLLGVTIPLLAVSYGYRIADIGVLVAISGAAQLVSRLWIGALLRKVSDKWLVIAAGVLLTASCLLITVSSLFAVFVISQLLQGAARAYFWTASQTHVVRVAERSVGGLARFNLAAGIGALAGPLAAGILIQFQGQWTLITGAIGSAIATVFAILLVRLPPFAPPAHSSNTRMWRRPEIRAGICMGTIAGSWRGILGSYVPVILAVAGISPVIVGTLATVANLAAVAGGSGIGLIRPLRPRVVLLVSGLATGLSVAALGLMAGDPILAGVCLAISGLGAGALQTISTAAVADAVHAEERGDSIATSGTYRAAALVLTPLIAAGVVAVAPISIAFVVVGLLSSVLSFLGGADPEPKLGSNAAHRN